MTYTILVVVQVFVALALIGLILVQHGKGADAGAAFGSGASGTVFGAQGSANFLSHLTAGLATLFFVLSLALAYLVGGNAAPAGSSVTQQLQQQQSQTMEMPEGTAIPDAPTTGSAGQAQQTGKTDTPVFNASANGQDGGQSADQGNKEGITAQIPE